MRQWRHVVPNTGPHIQHSKHGIDTFRGVAFQQTRSWSSRVVTIKTMIQTDALQWRLNGLHFLWMTSLSLGPVLRFRLQKRLWDIKTGQWHLTCSWCSSKADPNPSLNRFGGQADMFMDSRLGGRMSNLHIYSGLKLQWLLIWNFCVLKSFWWWVDEKLIAPWSDKHRTPLNDSFTTAEAGVL